MRSHTLFPYLLSLCLLIPVTANAEEVQTAKVYRDYPGYVNPAVCENPNVTKPAETAAPAPAPVPSTGDQPPAGKDGGGAAGAKEPPMTVPAADDQQQCTPAPYWEQADNPVDVPYVTVWAGAVATNDSDFDPHAEATFDTGYGVGAAIGFDFGPVRLEIEASHRSSDVDDVKVAGVDIDVDKELKIDALMLNGFADFKTGSNVTPYLGAGVGYARVELGGDDDDTVLAGQVAAGVLIAVTPTVAVDLGYRFMMTEDPKLEGEKFELQQHTAMLGLQIRF